MRLLGITHSHFDPSAALIVDGEMIAFVEEERLLRNKHALGCFPKRSIDFVLGAGGLKIGDIDWVVQSWDCAKYEDGRIRRHYDEINQRYATDDDDRAYQQRLLGMFQPDRQRAIVHRNLRQHFGNAELPEVRFVNHHLAHACTAYFFANEQKSLVLTIDGSGEEVTTVWWLGNGPELKRLREIKVPHSLGWLYSAFTEYLGFEAYDGEYKVMGLAAYGSHDDEIVAKLDRLVWYDGAGGFETDPLLLSRGPRSVSNYFPDQLAKWMGRPPRGEQEPITQWHQNCAFAVQNKLETVVNEMTQHWIEKTGVRRLCISGGVGLNVKMNGRLFADGVVDDLFVFPLCSDTGQAIGGPLAVLYEEGRIGHRPLEHVYVGNGYSDDEIQKVLRACKISFTEELRIGEKVAKLVADGHVVGWFQGRMEGGPRALGARSIIADPRNIESRDRVNEVIKYREPWRPFCPSMTEDGARRYLPKYTSAPFMIVTFHVNDVARREIPAVVHIDGTTRPQIVRRDINPRFYDMIAEFEKLTGVPCVLNTSFNIKGEPIVATPQDAIRTTFATGLDALAIGNCLIVKKGMT